MNTARAIPSPSPAHGPTARYAAAIPCGLAEQTLLLGLARRAIQTAIQGSPLALIKPENLSPLLEQKAATFVTLMLRGQLRGCVGNLEPRDPLYQSVMTNAVSAALRDSRFSPVTMAEVDELELHISILSALKPLDIETADEFLNQLRPGVDGVVLRQEGRTATFLPQVWEKIPDKVHFMESLCAKCGLPPAAWKLPRAELCIYQVHSFGDNQA